MVTRHPGSVTFKIPSIPLGPGSQQLSGTGGWDSGPSFDSDNSEERTVSLNASLLLEFQGE